MKVLMLLVAVAVCHGLPLNRKPKEEIDAFCGLIDPTLRTTMFYSDPMDCHSYYLCYFNPLDPTSLQTGHHFSCPPGTNWRSDYFTCVHNSDPNNKCGVDPCEDPVIKKNGFYVSEDKPNCRSFVQCANDVSVQRCCPDNQVFDAVLKQCVASDVCSDLCAERPEVEEEEEKSDVFEKGQTYTCTQGDYTFTVVNTKSFKRMGPDGVEIEAYCPEETPYFSYSRCTCYSKEDKPERDLTVPEGVVLSADQCYRDGLIYTRTGDITYFTSPVDGGVSTMEIKTCPSYKLFFRLSLCDCDVFVREDRFKLTEAQCIRGDHIYEKVDDHSYKMASMEDGVFGNRIHRCVTRTPLWNKDQCYCDVDPTASNEGPIVPRDTCNVYDMSASKLGASYVEMFGAFDFTEEEACFDGVNRLKIPYYSANTFGDKLSIALRFKYAVHGAYEMAPLIHNGVNDDQTIDISTSDSEVKVTLKVDERMCSVSIPNLKAVPRIFPPPPTTYDEIAFMFDGTLESGNMKLRVNTDTVYADCKGKVESSVHPMSIGGGVIGCVDDLYICKEVKDPLSFVNPL